MNRAILAILLLLSTVLVLYPSVTTLIDAQNAINDLASRGYSIPAVSVKARDNLVLQVVGFVFLYLFLGALLYYYAEQPKQQNIPDRSDENTPMIQLKQVVSLSQKTSNRLFVISGLVFIIVFMFQYFTNFSQITRSPDMMWIVSFTVYSMIAACIVGITLYVIVKYRIIEVSH